MNSTIKWPSWFVLTRHWLSLVGVALVTTAVISWVFVLPLRIRGHVDNPYVAIVIFLILPALFFTGLVLIPIAIYARKRQIRKVSKSLRSTAKLPCAGWLGSSGSRLL